MNLPWPFRRRPAVVVLPAPMPIEDYRAFCIGREVLLMANDLRAQAKFAPLAWTHMNYCTPEAGQFEVSVAIAGSASTFEEPRRMEREK